LIVFIIIFYWGKKKITVKGLSIILSIAYIFYGIGMKLFFKENIDAFFFLCCFYLIFILFTMLINLYSPRSPPSTEGDDDGGSDHEEEFYYTEMEVEAGHVAASSPTLSHQDMARPPHEGKSLYLNH
jgi:hypothetical protein